MLSHLLWLSVLSTDRSFRASTAFVDRTFPEHTLFPEMSRPLNFASFLSRVKKERGDRCWQPAVSFLIVTFQTQRSHGPETDSRSGSVVTC